MILVSTDQSSVHQNMYTPFKIRQIRISENLENIS